MTVYLVISLPKIPYIYTVYIWFSPTLLISGVCIPYHTAYWPHISICTPHTNLVALEALQELVHVVHQLLCRSPALVFGVVLQKHDDHGRDVIHTRRGLLQGFGLTQILRFVRQME